MSLLYGFDSSLTHFGYAVAGRGLELVRHLEALKRDGGAV